MAAKLPAQKSPVGHFQSYDRARVRHADGRFQSSAVVGPRLPDRTHAPMDSILIGPPNAPLDEGIRPPLHLPTNAAILEPSMQEKGSRPRVISIEVSAVPCRSGFGDDRSQLRLFSAKNFSTKSAIWTLFKSDIRKCVLPRMPIAGRCTKRASPPCLLMASTQSRAMASRTRQLS